MRAHPENNVKLEKKEEADHSGFIVQVKCTMLWCQVMSEIEVHRHSATGTLDSRSVMTKTVELLSSLPGQQHPHIDALLSQSLV